MTVTDAHSNRNKCKFQMALVPEPCAPWSLPTDERSVQKECQRHASGTICQLECRKGFRFVGIAQQIGAATARPTEAPAMMPQRYICSLEPERNGTGAGRWVPRYVELTM